MVGERFRFSKPPPAHSQRIFPETIRPISALSLQVEDIGWYSDEPQFMDPAPQPLGEVLVSAGVDPGGSGSGASEFSLPPQGGKPSNVRSEFIGVCSSQCKTLGPTRPLFAVAVASPL